MADTRTPVQSEVIRDFLENNLPALFSALHTAEDSLPSWENREAAGTAKSLSEQARLFLDDGEVGNALDALGEVTPLEAAEMAAMGAEPETLLFALAAGKIKDALEDWRQGHGLDEEAQPRTYPTAESEPLREEQEETAAPAPMMLDSDREAAPELSAWRPDERATEMEPAPSVEYADPETTPWAPMNIANKEVESEKVQSSQPERIQENEKAQESTRGQQAEEQGQEPPALDMPNDQEAAALAGQRVAEEKEAQQLLAGKSLDADKPTEPATPSNESEDKVLSQEEKQEAQQSPQRPERAENDKPLSPEKDSTEKPKETPVVEEQSINANNMTIRSPGFLTTLAQGFVQGREEHRAEKTATAQAKRQDAAREKYVGFTQAAHDLERQSESVLHHPVMDAVRQAAPDGLAKATDAQKQLVSSIVQSNPEFQQQVERLQNRHDALVSKFDALSPDLDQIPAKERQAYGQIADKHLKKIEKNLQEIPDKKGNDIWQRLKESFRAIGQRLGLVGPDMSVPRQTVAQGQQNAPAMAPRMGRR